jgi:DNA polymerase III epsilon subunit-like protein
VSSTEPDRPAAPVSQDGAAPEATPDRASGGTRFVFIDTEATGLDHSRHELTEVAWIVRFEDGREEERRYFPQHTIDGADDDALELTHYEERIAPQEKTPAKVWLTELLDHAEGAVLVGAVPDFDARHLDLACRKLRREPTWDHHLLDVETLALPLIAPGPETPRSLAKTCAALGIPHDKDQAHGALYDAQQARAVFDRVWQLVADLRASGDPLPPPVPREQPGQDRSEGQAPATDDATATAVESSGATDTGQPPHAPA